MYCIVWTYDVEAGRARAFERAYGPDGDWAALFGRSKGFLGSALFQDTSRADRYLTVDYWASESSWREFQRTHASEYEALDRQLAHLSIAQYRVAAGTG